MATTKKPIVRGMRTMAVQKQPRSVDQMMATRLRQSTERMLTRLLRMISERPNIKVELLSPDGDTSGKAHGTTRLPLYQGAYPIDPVFSVILNTVKRQKVTTAQAPAYWRSKATLRHYLALSYHELAHIMHTPMGDIHILYKGEWAVGRVSNMLEDLRIENLMVATYLAVRPFFIYNVVKVIMDDYANKITTLSMRDWAVFYCLTYGRRFLPTRIRREVANRAAQIVALDVMKELAGYIDEYNRLSAREVVSDKGVHITRSVAQILASLPAVNNVEPPTDEMHQGSPGGITEHSQQKNVPNIDDPDDHMEDQDFDELEAEADAEDAGAEGQGDSDADGDEDQDSDADGDGDDQDQDGDQAGDGSGGDDDLDDHGSDPQGGGDDPETMADMLNSDVNAPLNDAQGAGGQSAGSGDPDAPDGPQKASEKHLDDFLQDVMEDIDLEKQIGAEVSGLNQSILDGAKGAMLDRKVAFAGERAVEGEMAQTARHFAREMQVVADDSDSGWSQSQPWGSKINIQRVLTHGPLGEVWSQWKEDQMPDTGVEMTLLLDVSGSMSGVTEELSAAAWGIASAMQEHPGNRLTIMTYSDEAKIMLVPGQRVSKAKFSVLNDEGGTHATEALREALGVHLFSPMRRQVMLIMTDGDWSDNNTANALIMDMKSLGITTGLAFLNSYHAGYNTDSHGCDFYVKINKIGDLVNVARRVTKINATTNGRRY